MAQLPNYHHYDGHFPTTAAIGNALSYQGVLAPHTGKPYSQGMLMGIAGGIAFGYFTFAYEGYDLQVNLLTRNTFHNYGWDAVARRLRLTQDVIHATRADRARSKLIELLEAGVAPIVWADPFTLGYESSELGDQMWAMMPMVVADYDQHATVADRAQAPIRVPAQLLDQARARIKKDKFKIITLDAAQDIDLAAAVRGGIADCIALFVDRPPRGSAKNFGFAAYRRWIAALTKPNSTSSWAKIAPPGRQLFAALTTAFKYGLLYWKDASCSADRLLFAQFLTESAQVLGDDRLIAASSACGRIAALWQKLGSRLLPDEVPLLRAAREALNKRHRIFLERGNAAPDELGRLDAELRTLTETADELLPQQLGTDSSELLQQIATAVAAIWEAERELILELQTVVAVDSSA